MKAVVLEGITPASEIKLSEVDIPEVKPGWVLVKVKGFGLNHSEQVLRKQEIQASYIQKPVIPGIECVGEIVDPSDTSFQKGERVCALMGGMGRTFNGGYAEYALLPAHHVFHANTSLDWKDLAAVPETYFTAWGSLFECLHLKPEDTLLIRGATCALGYVCIQIAKELGCTVIATTHKESKLDLIKEADIAVVDDSKLEGKFSGITKALDLVGPRALRDTLRAVKKGGIVCDTGILGGVFTLNQFDPIKEIPNGVYLTGFFSNTPTQSDMDEIFAFIEKHHLIPPKGAIYPFKDVQKAILAQDEGSANGKIVVVME
jgi:NADPH:quinone reductase-like Zn-dependent oxidoreductase